ncbi:hypothetical protein B0H14DRAFT_2591079, partial [Mycena olivaceomarginata]
MAQLSFFSIILLSAIAETFLYGIFMVSFFVALYLRLSKYTDRTARSEALRNTILIPTIVTFVTCSAVLFASSKGLPVRKTSTLPFIPLGSSATSGGRQKPPGDFKQFDRGCDDSSGFVLSYLFTHLRPENISYTEAWITVGWVLTTV